MTRAITLNAQEVHAILAGELTQLWRPITKIPVMRNGMAPDHIAPCIHSGKWTLYDEHNNCHSCDGGIRCPFGAIGDHLWVRETWAPVYLDYDYESGQCDDVWGVKEIPKVDPREQSTFCQRQQYAVYYRANGEWDTNDNERPFCWRSPLVMPQWASRITLVNESVDAIKVDDTWQWRVTFKRKDKSE